MPSLVDDKGLFFTSVAAAQLLAQARLDDVERELTAQIDAVGHSGLTPTHLDCHALADGGRPDILELTVHLARHYGLAARVWLQPGQQIARSRGLPVVDHDFLDSFSLDLTGKTERYLQLLRALPAGLSEWAVHPAISEPTTNQTDLSRPVRQSDHAFLTSAAAHRVLDEENIVVVDYHGLQRLWLGPRARPASTGSF